MSLAAILDWKFNSLQGMCTRGGSTITAFPANAIDRDGNIRQSVVLPSKAEIDQWTAEYTAWLAEQPAPKTPQEEIAELKAQILALKSGVNDTRTKVALAPIDFTAVEAEATVEIKPK